MEQKKSSKKVAILAFAVVAVIFFLIGFVVGARQARNIYATGIQIASFLTWFIPILIVVLILILIAFFYIRSKKKNTKDVVNENTAK